MLSLIVISKVSLPVLPSTALQTVAVGIATTGWRIVLLGIATGIGASVLQSAETEHAPVAHVGAVAWARLKTRSPYWDRHEGIDEPWLKAVRACTSIDIDQHWHEADVGKLSELCQYPLVFAANMTDLSKTEGGNLREYLLRGGFLIMDACLDSRITPSRPGFVATEIDYVTAILPEARIVILEPKHPIFSVFYQMTEFPPQARQSIDEPINPLRAVYVGKRMVGVISLSGFQCGLEGHGRFAPAADTAKMLVNIYVYAMSQ